MEINQVYQGDALEMMQSLPKSMDYMQVNTRHFWLIRQICVDRYGKCLILLRKGGVLFANSPKEADNLLRLMERKDNNE